MIRRQKPAKWALVVALVVAAVAFGSAAARAAFFIGVQAHLAPVTGTKATGQFNGVLVRNTGGGKAARPGGSSWQLSWRLSLPALKGPMATSLRIGRADGAAQMMRLLCAQCSTSANGTTTLTSSQVSRMGDAHGVVVVRTRSATLRGTIKMLVHVAHPEGR